MLMLKCDEFPSTAVVDVQGRDLKTFGYLGYEILFTWEFTCN